MSFQIVDRAAAGRLGRFKTNHGPVTTPTLMPVINPNIDLVSPAEMRDLFGCEMVITNSYVIQKYDKLREAALADGVHKLIGWDGALMTDSGTFQMYVYGDVEVGPEEIVQFQRDIGVDVATCLDRFVVPETGHVEAAAAVEETIRITRESVAHKGNSLLNATVQGGIHGDLRQHCARSYRDLDVDYHTIGGVVPIMERQMYPELVDVILASQSGLRKDRPVHLFGAGHPLVFPLAVALGCDLFDSSSYAKYAKDGRIMTLGGTLHLRDMVEEGEWPLSSRFLGEWTPRQLSKAPQRERERVLALHNLDVCFGDMRRIRRAIRDGTLWELVEQRAACHPLLAAATRRLRNPAYQSWLEEREPVSGRKAIKYTGSLTHNRPIFHRIRRRLLERLVPHGVPVPAEDLVDNPWAKAGQKHVELGMHKEPSTGGTVRAVLGKLDGEQDHVSMTGMGPIFAGLDEMYPFSQSVMPRLDGLDVEHMGWVGQTKDAVLEHHGFVPAIPGPGDLDLDLLQVTRTADWQFGAGAGSALTAGEVRLEKSPRTHKLRTVHVDGEHVLSLRAHDGMWTLKTAGARLLHGALPAPANRVVVDGDSVPFNRDGKSVFAQFVLACDEALRPGDECLVVDESDNLVAVGHVILNAEEMRDFQGGMAVRVREGIPT